MTADSDVLFPCPRCGEEGQVAVGQSIFHDELLWYESNNCIQCGLRTEADGKGFPPKAMREKILLKNGRWKLMLLSVRSVPVVTKILKDHLSLSTKEALGVLRSRNDGQIYEGTNVEVLWLCNQLRKSGENPQALPI
jgi:hypothetical protein